MYNASLHLGLTVGPILGILLAPAHAESQAFLFFAAVCLTGAAILFVFLKGGRPGEARERGEIAFREMRLLAANGRTLAIFAGIVLYGAGYGMFLTVIPAFLICAARASTGLPSRYFSPSSTSPSASPKLSPGPCLTGRAGVRSWCRTLSWPLQVSLSFQRSGNRGYTCCSRRKASDSACSAFRRWPF